MGRGEYYMMEKSYLSQAIDLLLAHVGREVGRLIFLYTSLLAWRHHLCLPLASEVSVVTSRTTL